LNDVLSENIRRIRKERELSQDRLAELAGTTQGYLWRIEAGLANPTVEMIQAIARALHVDPVKDLLEPH